MIIKPKPNEYLIPNDILEVFICDEAAPPKKSSFTSTTSYISRLFAREALIRDNGLNLLVVCTHIKNEILPLLNRLTLRFHCLNCLKELLSNISHGLGVGITWIKHIEILVTVYDDLTSGRPDGPQRLTPELIRVMAREHALEVMTESQRITSLYCGRWDLGDQEMWTCERLRDKPLTEDSVARRNALPNGWYIFSTTPSGITGDGRTVYPNRWYWHGLLSTWATSNGGEKWLISGWLDI
ncbi:hypothetical protein RBB50_000188 [Rhinocladiella similis]